MSSSDQVPKLPGGLQNSKLEPAETARYSKDLLESLRKIALKQGHSLLAHLLGLAAQEAKSLAEVDHAQETRLPE